MRRTSCLWAGLTTSFLRLCRILLSFVSKLQISINHFIQDDINTYYLVNGVLQKTYAVESNPGLLNYNLAERERRQSAAQLFSQALWKVSFHDLANTAASLLPSAFWPPGVARTQTGTFNETQLPETSVA